MLNVFQRAKSYYESAPSDPWRWAEKAQVLVWADGSTIAFREELAEILEELAPSGLPPFRIVVLILAACRGKLPPSSENGPAIRELVRPVQINLPPPLPGADEPVAFRVWNDPSNQEFSELLARLRRLHELPAEQKGSPRAKAILVESISEQMSVSRVQPGREIAQALREIPALRDLNGTENREQETANACRLLHVGLRAFSEESLALRLRTGLDALPAAAEVELRPSERARQLLAVLRTDPEQQGLAKVARDIMAALYLPRSVSELDELALGGFSDIANRGNLDRLLPSELANDDLTLATRIALNEALYIRREPPSTHPPARLAVLLDIGVRQWGLPRVFATAVALAFIAKEERCTEAAVWQARRTTIEKVDLLSRNGLISHLSALDTYAHPGAVLKQFFGQFGQQPEMEAVLVTHRDCVGDPEFQRYLAEIDWKRFYIATVERDGSFELFAHPHRQKALCQAEIALDALFPERTTGTAKARASLRNERQNSHLPLILSVKPFPFLLPVLGKVEWPHQLANRGGLAILKDRRLIRWDGPGKGAYTLVETLPPGKTFWLGTTDYGKRVHVLKVLTATGVSTLTTWDGATGEATTTELAFWREVPQQVYERNGVLYILSRTEASAWQLDGAQPLGKIELPTGTRLLHQKYVLQANGKCSYLSLGSSGLSLEPAGIRAKLAGVRILALFERAGLESLPWVLTAMGEVYSGDGNRVINLQEWINRFHISADGHQLLLYPMAKPHCHLVNLEKGTAMRLPAHRGFEVFWSRVDCPTRSVRVKLDRAGIAPSGELMLKTTAGKWHQVSLVEKALRLIPVQGGSSDVAFSASFEPVPVPVEFNLRLKMAAWPDGSRAWLDSRGMLHLKRGNSSDPEVSLVLADGPMAAWSSDGKTCGPDFFLREPATADAATLMQRLQLFCPIT